MTRRRIIIGVIVLLVPLIGFTQCVWAPPVYWGEAIHARVIDADTGEPVPDAVVVVDWELYGGGVGHGGYHNSLLTQETTTGANGDFTIPEWGPKRRPIYAILNYAPWLLIFKTGYDHRVLLNEHDENGFVRRSDWSRRTIALKRTARVGAARVELLRLVLANSALQPLMLAEILKEGQLYHRLAPAFFDHVSGLLATNQRMPQ